MLNLRCSVFILLVFSFISGCKQEREKKSPVVSEGIIEYKISYPSDLKNNSFSFLLPGEMKYFFRPNQERISFKGNMGLYILDFISNHRSDSTITLLKILNNKMLVSPSESRDLFIFSNLQNGTVVFHKDTIREILGYEVQKASIHWGTNGKTDIDVWYAPSLNTESTNKNTPFSKIPGVMLEFSIYYNNIHFLLKSDNINEVTLDESVFQVPADYTVTSITEIEKMITDIMN
jgi:hypothetical protein